MTKEVKQLETNKYEIILNFNDEVKVGTDSTLATTSAIVIGEPISYISVLENDFRQNNKDLFPEEELIIEHLEMGGLNEL